MLRVRLFITAITLTFVGWMAVGSPCQAQGMQGTYWSVWKPSDKRALDLIGDGYELKSAFADGKAEFGYLQKGESMFRCVLSQFDLGINQLATPTYLCAELTKPYRREL